MYRNNFNQIILTLLFIYSSYIFNHFPKCSFNILCPASPRNLHTPMVKLSGYWYRTIEHNCKLSCYITLYTL